MGQVKVYRFMYEGSELAEVASDSLDKACLDAAMTLEKSDSETIELVHGGIVATVQCKGEPDRKVKFRGDYRFDCFWDVLP